MLAVVKETPGPGVVLKDVPIPKPQVGEMLVKVLKTSICGTDVGIYDWIPWAEHHINPPKIIGHEVVGKIVEINGQGHKFQVGDLVSSETHIFCGSCYQCAIGNMHLCLNMQLFGIGRDGSFAQYATIPLKTAWKNSPHLDIDVMSVQEPLGNAVHATSKARVQNKKVLILGLGPVGLCAGAASKFYQAGKVYAIDTEKYRQELAINSGWFDFVGSTLNQQELGSFDVVLEVSGNQDAISLAFQAVSVGGKIVAVGIPKEKITFDWGEYLINKELTIESIFGRKIWQTWEDTSHILASGKVDLKKIITHHFPLSKFEEAMTLMKSRQCGKIILEP